jgi:pilus assembly protein Flp/PilA
MRIGETTLHTLNERMRDILRDRRGVTALEYGIIAGVLGLALIAIFKSFGGHLSTLFSGVGASI